MHYLKLFFVKTSSHILLTPNTYYCSLMFPLKQEQGMLKEKLVHKDDFTYQACFKLNRPLLLFLLQLSQLRDWNAYQAFAAEWWRSQRRAEERNSNLQLPHLPAFFVSKLERTVCWTQVKQPVATAMAH